MRSPFLLWERRTMAEAGRGFLEEMRNKMREKRGLGREEAEREEWNDGCFVRPTYCWVYVIWRLIGLYYWGGRTAGCPTLSAKGGTTRLQFSPFLQRRRARAVKTRRLSDYMAHLTLSPYFLDTVRHLTLYIVLPPFLNITRWVPARCRGTTVYLSAQNYQFHRTKKTL